jgi:sulfatase maturation enzyme AslB (radical SAM superfamily)
MCCDKIQKIVTILNKCKIKKNSNNCKEDCIYEFINFLTNNQTKMTTIDIFFDMLEEFIEQLIKQKKKVINKKIIINKLYDFNMNSDFVNENRLDTLIDHIFTD